LSCILQVNNISKDFERVRALNNISFSLEKGTITSLIGPNGAGKTTLFNVISGIIKTSSGKVFFKDVDITDFSPDAVARKKIARTFQNVELFKKLTVIENVMISTFNSNRYGFISAAMRIHPFYKKEKKIKEDAFYYLTTVGLENDAFLQSSLLPFGKQRLLEIARAIALKPELLLLDEPAAGLNASETENLAILVQKIKNNGVTVLLIEHSMNLVMDISDVITVLDCGELLAQGSPQDIQKNEKVIKAYIGET